MYYWCHINFGIINIKYYTHISYVEYKDISLLLSGYISRWYNTEKWLAYTITILRMCMHIRDKMSSTCVKNVRLEPTSCLYNRINEIPISKNKFLLLLLFCVIIVSYCNYIVLMTTYKLPHVMQIPLNFSTQTILGDNLHKHLLMRCGVHILTGV